MSRELDIECARTMGWEVNEREPGEDEPRFKTAVSFVLWQYTPAFSTDPAAARLLEDDIEARGLQERYIRAFLDVILDGGVLEGTGAWWSIIRATPEERARAFLATLHDAPAP